MALEHLGDLRDKAMGLPFSDYLLTQVLDMLDDAFDRGYTVAQAKGCGCA